MNEDLLRNLEDLQRFEAAMRQGALVDRIANRFIAAIMFEPVAARRASAIDALKTDLFKHFKSNIVPAANTLGERGAIRIIQSLGGSVPADIRDPVIRRRALVTHQIRTEDRLRIVQYALDAQGKTLESRLAAHYLEPGQNAEAKVKRLVERHNELEDRQNDYEKKLRDFHAGKTAKRPAKPKLDLVSDLKASAKETMRQQARRIGTDAETASFIAAGFSVLGWVTVNADQACPQCQKRQGMSGDMAFWDENGRPGSGATYCGTSCYCMLVPVAAIERKGLQQGFKTPAKR